MDSMTVFVLSTATFFRCPADTVKFCMVVKIAFIIAHTRNNVVVLFGTLKVQCFVLTEVRDCDLLIVVTSSTSSEEKTY